MYNDGERGARASKPLEDRGDSTQPLRMWPAGRLYRMQYYWPLRKEQPHWRHVNAEQK